MAYEGNYKKECYCIKGCNDKKFFDSIGVAFKPCLECPVCGGDMRIIR